MGVRVDCRHYLVRTISANEQVQRCRIDVAQTDPFSCPEDCILFEPRSVSGAGWAQAPRTPMSNTADRLAQMEPEKKIRRKKKRG